jgi:hypothetical protein
MDFSKLKQTAFDPKKALNPEEEISVIIIVKQANYHPECVQLRAQISELIFTANCKNKDIEVLENDPLVEQVSGSKKLQSYHN